MASSQQKFILVNIGRQTWSLPLVDSSDFFQLKNIVPIPQTNDKIVGLTYHQGHIVTVLASDKILGTKLMTNDQNCLRIDWQGDHYGLLIDKVGEIIIPDKISKDSILFNKKKIDILSISNLLSKLA